MLEYRIPKKILNWNHLDRKKPGRLSKSCRKTGEGNLGNGAGVGLEMEIRNRKM